MAVDVLIAGGTVVPMSGATRGTARGAEETFVGDVLLSGGRIVGLFPGGMAAAKRREGPRAQPRPLRVVDARGCAVLPGFVQAHVHLCQVLFRGMADDLPLLEWLKRRIWPLEGAHDEASLGASARLGLAEMTRAGTTAILDMGTVHGHDAVMEAADASGLRVVSGKTMMDAGEGVPKALRETTRGSLGESEALEKRWSGRGNGRLHYAYAPRFILSCTEALFRGVAERSRAHGTLVHSHVAEHPAEAKAVRDALGDDDIRVLRRWGIKGPRTVLAHGVQLKDAHAREVARDQTRIVHCPSANLKLGSGIARVADLDALRVPLALGADGAPCNNNLDPWVELRHAALLAKVRTGTTALPARRALRLATLDGARALGLDKTTGSLEVGKAADLQVVDLGDLHVIPGGDVFSRLVYACQARDVRHVFVDGEELVARGELTRVDAHEVAAHALEEARKVKARAGL